MRILGLDLGTNTGVAFFDGTTTTAETWVLGTKAEIKQWGQKRVTRRSDPRIQRFFEKLQKLIVAKRPDLIVFEDVQFSTYTLQTQLWASLRAALWLGSAGVTIDCVPVTTLKKFAGHGGANKEMMAAALFKRYPEFRNQNLDDNAIDAIWIMQWAKHHLGRIGNP